MITEKNLDDVFHALAHKTRREILDVIRANPGSAVGKVASRFDVSRIAIMNHLSVLESAGLVVSEKDGRTRSLYLNLVPIQMIYDRWTDAYSAHWATRVTALKYAAENKAKKKDAL